MTTVGCTKVQWALGPTSHSLPPPGEVTLCSSGQWRLWVETPLETRQQALSALVSCTPSPHILVLINGEVYSLFFTPSLLLASFHL